MARRADWDARKVAHFHGLTLLEWQAQPRQERVAQMAFFELQHMNPKEFARQEQASAWANLRVAAAKSDAWNAEQEAQHGH